MFNLFVLIICYSCIAFAVPPPSNDLKCNVRAYIESGFVCGLIREAEHGVKYASFRGIPYAQQPLGELRFKELQPAIPWPHHLDATEEGPVCPQHDELYGRLAKRVRGMSESCIYANVHVPIEALPKIQRGDETNNNGSETKILYHAADKAYPIFVFIHGGGFAYGSGDDDLHGPEYLLSKGIIVITFNYRLNVFGFLSLNTTKIPGNAGLRDQLTLLRWVQRNARTFGGDPHEVTLAGQSAGAASAHLLSMSADTKGLFKGVMLMSGTAFQAFYTASPIYANQIAGKFLKAVGINSTDPDFIHDELIKMPLENIINALGEIQYEAGLVSFSPVVEAKHAGVTRIIKDDPDKLIESGYGKEYPMIIGFTNNECEFFRYRFDYLKMLQRIKANPTLVLAAGIPYATTPDVSLYLSNLVIERYFNGKMNNEDYLVSCKDTIIEYPAFQLARSRAKMNGAPTYLYQFNYVGEYNVMKEALYKQYEGTMHIEDLTYIFRENAMLGDMKFFPLSTRDDHMKDWMTDFVINFVRCNNPSCDKGWLPVEPQILNYQSVDLPGVYSNIHPTPDQWDMIHFHDKIHRIARGIPLECSVAQMQDQDETWTGLGLATSHLVSSWSWSCAPESWSWSCAPESWYCSKSLAKFCS